MAAPFIDNVAGVVTAAPGTGSFTPSGAYANAVAWATVPQSVYLYRAEEAGQWEIGYTLWNGATLTRAVLLSSNANGLVNFGANVIIALTNGADEVQPHIGGSHWGMWLAKAGGTTVDALGLAPPTLAGTPTAQAIASTNGLSRRTRLQLASATTAAAVAGLSNVSSGAGLLWSTDVADIGFEFTTHVGWASFAAAHRIMIGMSSAAMVAGTLTEPSTTNNSLFFGKDTTDTNFQLIRRSGTTTTKIDLGVAPAANVPYEFVLNKPPGNLDVIATFIRLDNSGPPIVTRIAAGAVNLPTNNTVLFPVVQSGIGSTTGTASTMHFMHTFLRNEG